MSFCFTGVSFGSKKQIGNRVSAKNVKKAGGGVNLKLVEKIE